jgi:hypothetical protein
MKSIQVITDSTYFTVYDKDSEEIQNYTRSLSNILESQKVVILHTTEHSVIIRPSKVTAVIVSDVSDDEPIVIVPQPTTKIEQHNPLENPEQNSETKRKPIEEDVITDMDE